MNHSDLRICILAAGKGTRMNSDLPKVLHKINNKTLLQFVIETSESLNPNAPNAAIEAGTANTRLVFVSTILTFGKFVFKILIFLF